MNPKVNFAIVGLFVLIFGTGFIAWVIWFSFGVEQKSYTTYKAYMYQSVSGLNVNSNVKYRGVNVGNVKKLNLDYENPERVILFLDIEANTPIKEDTVAVLTMQGITGLAYIELTGGTRESKDLVKLKGENYAEIKTQPSLMVRMDTAVTQLLDQLNKVGNDISMVANNLNKFLGESNQKAAGSSLANIDKLTALMSDRMGDLAKNFDNVTSIIADTAKLSRELPDLMKRTSESLLSIQNAVKVIDRTAASFDKALSGTQKELTQSAGDSISEFSQLIQELQQLTATLNSIAHDFERDPNMVIFGRTKDRAGPGERP